MVKDNLVENNIITKFISEWFSQQKPLSSLHISTSAFNLIDKDSLSFTYNIEKIDWKKQIKANQKIDFIFGDLPLGSKIETYNFFTHKLRISQNWITLLETLQLLSAEGIGIYIIEPSFFMDKGKKIKKALADNNYHISAIFNAPKDLLQPHTSLATIFVAITKIKTDSTFVAEMLEEKQTINVVKRFFNKENSENLSDGIILKEDEFYNFHRIQVRQQIERLETQYKNYSEYLIDDIALEINRVPSGKTLIERKNAIYIPTIGNSPVVSNLQNTKLKHHNLFQVILNESANNDYLTIFFKSQLGKLILSFHTSGTFINHLNKSDLKQMLIALPKKEEQNSIVELHKKLEILKNAISELDSEVALNPFVVSTSNQIDQMLESINAINDDDRLRSIVRQGESKVIEFKESLSLDIRKGTKEKYIEKSALKTVAAFLNTDGGVLLIGVSDDGDFVGVNQEIEKFHKSSLDNFLLHWKNLCKHNIGAQYYPFLESKIIHYEEKIVLKVECKSSPKPCYIDKDFYVRTNPATDKLEGPELVEYVSNHF